MNVSAKWNFFELHSSNLSHGTVDRNLLTSFYQHCFSVSRSRPLHPFLLKKHQCCICLIHGGHLCLILHARKMPNIMTERKLSWWRHLKTKSISVVFTRDINSWILQILFTERVRIHVMLGFMKGKWKVESGSEKYESVYKFIWKL